VTSTGIGPADLMGLRELTVYSAAQCIAPRSAAESGGL